MNADMHQLPETGHYDEPVPSSHHTRYLVLLAVIVLGYLLVRNHPWT